MNLKHCLITLVVLALFCHSNIGHAQNFLLNAPASPQAIGTAGLYTSSNTDDPLAPISNPALLGFMAERNRLMVGFFPQRMRWSIFDGQYTFTHSARALYLGFDRETLSKYFSWQSPISFGIGYQEVYLNEGDIQQPDENGHVIGQYHAYEKSEGYTLSAAAHFRYWQGSFGFGQRFSVLNYTLLTGVHHLYSSDLGLYLQAPLERLMYTSDPVSDGHMNIRPFCTPAISYALMNVGPEYTPANDEPRIQPPRIAKLGWNVSAGVHALHPRSKQDWQIVSLAYGVEAEDLLFGRNRGQYQGIFGDIRPGTNLIEGKLSKDVDVLIRHGFEIGVAEFAYWRGGSSNGVGGAGFDLGMITKGYGFRLSGLVKLMDLGLHYKPSPAVDFVMHHLDIQYDHSKLMEDDGQKSTLDGVTYNEIALLLKY